MKSLSPAEERKEKGRAHRTYEGGEQGEVKDLLHESDERLGRGELRHVRHTHQSSKICLQSSRL